MWLRKMMKCYNCGIELDNQKVTREHIPPQNLFEGFPNEYKSDRITVPSCFNCNNGKSILDEEFRNLIGVISNNPLNKSITEKTIRGIKRRWNSYENRHVLLQNKFPGVIFNENGTKDYIKSIFKGIYFDETQTPLPNEFDIYPILQNQKIPYSLHKAMQKIRDNYYWKFSGNRRVFEYTIKEITFKNSRYYINSLTNKTTPKYIVAILTFNTTLTAIVLATTFKP